MECPAIAEIARSLRTAIPQLTPPSKLGTIRSDGSRHQAGLAIDIMLHSQDDSEKVIADQIIAALVKLHSKIKWFDLIYTDWDYMGQPFYFHIPGGGPYGGTRLEKNKTNEALGKQHVNHIHLDYALFPGDPKRVSTWPPEARTTGFGTELIFELSLDQKLRQMYGFP